MGAGDTGIEFELLVESSLRFSSCESGKGQGSGETRWPLVDSCTVVICNVIAEVHSGQRGYYVDNSGPVENCAGLMVTCTAADATAYTTAHELPPNSRSWLPRELAKGRAYSGRPAARISIGLA